MTDTASMVRQLLMMQPSIEAGNIPLANRPQVPVGGGTATVRSMSVGLPRGETLIPTIREDGWPMSPEQAVGWYRKTGKHLGIFKTPEEANRYAQMLHLEQAKMYGK